MYHYVRTIVPAIVLLTTAGAGTAAARVCGNQDFKGVYGPLNQGSVVFSVLPQLVGPFARTGRAVADGKGGFTASTIDSVNGFIGPGEINGTYSVSPECALTLNLFVPLPGLGTIPFTFLGAIAENGRLATVMPIDPPGLVIQVNLRRQDERRCSDSDLKGGYLVNQAGSLVFQAPNPPGLFQRVGIVTFDGKGQLAADTHASYGGVIRTETFTGSYVVDSSCQFTIDYTLGGTAYTWSGMLTDNSQGATLLVTSPMGAVVTGTLKQQ